MTGSREDYPQPGAEPAGDSRESSSDWADPAEADPEGLAGRVEALRRRDAEDPRGRWFLPLASALHVLDRAAEAAQVLRRGLAKDPDCLGGWVLMGRCYLAMGEVEIAKGLLESSAARDPENALALRGLAQVHALEGDRRRAVEEYRVLLRLMPRDLEAHEALAWLLAQGETETPSLLAAKATPRRPSRRQAPRPVYPPRGSRAALKAEPRVNPGLFEAPPADLDRDAASPVAQRRERRSKTANRSPRVLDHVDTPELSVSGAEPKAPVRRSLKDYEQWMQRMAQNQVPARDDPQDGSNPVDPIASGGE